MSPQHAPDPVKRQQIIALATTRSTIPDALNVVDSLPGNYQRAVMVNSLPSNIRHDVRRAMRDRELTGVSCWL